MKTENNVINVNQRATFLVKLRYQMNQQYIVQNDGLLKVLKECDKNGIEFIKVMDVQKQKFVRCSRDYIRQVYSWDTETDLYLSNHYFFK